MLDFADRFHFDAGARLALRAGVSRLAARAVASRRNRCAAPTPAGCSITRALRSPWCGGFISLARAAGVDRIEPGAASHFPSCFAPAVDDRGLEILTLAA